MTTPMPPIVTRAQWEKARADLLVREKELMFDLLDLTPDGRQETWEESPDGWPQEPPYEWMRLADSY